MLRAVRLQAKIETLYMGGSEEEPCSSGRSGSDAEEGRASGEAPAAPRTGIRSPGRALGGAGAAASGPGRPSGVGPGSGRGPKGGTRGGPAGGRHNGKGAGSGEVKPKGVGANAGGRTAAPQRRPAGTFSRLAEPRGAQQAPRKRKGGCRPTHCTACGRPVLSKPEGR